MSPGGPLDFQPDEPPRAASDDEPAGRGPAAPNDPPRGFSSPAAPSRRYGTFLMVAALLLIGYVTINALSSSGPGSTGIPDGHLAPGFAGPLAQGTVTGDVNVATVADQGAAGAVPACSVRRPGVLTSCLLTDSGPTVIAFFVTLGSRCENELDVLQRVHRAFPQVRVAAVSIRGSRSEAAELAQRRGWTFPVVYDHDGILANLYGVAVCPQLTYVLPGGRVEGTTLGSIGEAGLRAQFVALQAAARREGWRGR